MEKEAKQMIDLKRNLFKIDVRAQKDEEKVFMRTAWLKMSNSFTKLLIYGILFFV
ncbi:hypothetical protein SDSE_2251 [Streptococcus dysgalactiae subsp. equisimilis AC-2713]|uniref:Uncharacterized protein n=1 Tax=Streptococcus dysgalactiae subsp. equisimilis AC-2713 TaxID=759913 RepID=A0AB33R935_STREQ|nr:hypothetical protein SDSE_2251 [Streptococcus dysgalactiae subsp. equisimilis AC-2713]